MVIDYTVTFHHKVSVYTSKIKLSGDRDWLQDICTTGWLTFHLKRFHNKSPSNTDSYISLLHPIHSKPESPSSMWNAVNCEVLCGGSVSMRGLYKGLLLNRQMSNIRPCSAKSYMKITGDKCSGRGGHWNFVVREVQTCWSMPISKGTRSWLN